MLNLLEKIQFIVSGVVVLGAIALYIIWPPQIRPLDTLPDVKITQRAPPKKAAGALLTTKEAKPEIPPADQEILDKLTKLQNVKGLAGKSLEHNDCQVDKQTLEYVKREPNWLPELKKAKSEFLRGADGRNTRIKLFDLEAGSLFKKFGFQEGDVVELIDGEQIDFDAGAMDHTQRSKRLMEKIENGGKISLTITRGGKPIQLEFKVK
jgi:hypothetical protein